MFEVVTHSRPVKITTVGAGALIVGIFLVQVKDQLKRYIQGEIDLDEKPRQARVETQTVKRRVFQLYQTALSIRAAIEDLTMSDGLRGAELCPHDVDLRFKRIFEQLCMHTTQHGSFDESFLMIVGKNRQDFQSFTMEVIGYIEQHPEIYGNPRVPHLYIAPLKLQQAKTALLQKADSSRGNNSL